MHFFLLVLILCFDSGGGGAVHYQYVKKDYLQTHTDNIILQLDNHNDAALTVTRIRWCGSKTHPITSCSEPDLYRVSLFPRGGGDNQVEIKNNGREIHIDPSLIGGWDYTAHSQIIVEAQDSKQKLFQTFAFENPDDNKKAEIARPGDQEPQTVGVAETPAAPASQMPSSENQISPPTLPWKGMGVLFIVGLFALLSMGYIAHKKRHLFVTSVPKALRVGDFELIPPSHDVEEHDDDEQLQLLMSMGHGANAVFSKNL